MQRMSRAQRILVIYLLLKSREPRVIKKIIRNYGGGIGKHGNDMHTTAYTAVTSISDLTTKDHDLLDGLTDDDHTQYFHTDGTDAATGDFDMATNGIIFSDAEINRYAAGVLRIVTPGTTTLKHLRLANLFASGYTCSSAASVFRTTSTGRLYFQAWTGAWTTCATLDSVADEFSVSRAGDISFLDAKFPILDKASGNGIKIDTTAPTFGWRDLLGQIRTRGVGGTDPNDATYIGNIKAYQFSVNDECWVDYHIPHDYVKGTDIYLHFHWSHNNALVTGGNVTWGADITYAKGHDQAPFPASVNTTVVGNASTTQYQHIITEIQVSTSGGGAGQIDTDNLEPDGVIMIRGYLSANNITVSGGGVPDPFLHFKDIHYQSTNIATKDKVPDFYT